LKVVMDVRGEGVRGEDGKAAARRNWLAIARIVAANANPVVGVWFLGWQPLSPIFFYWLDGLLAIWGLGVVAAVVTSREKPKNFGASGAKLWLIWVAVIGLMGVILAIPSVFPAIFVLKSLHRDVGEVLREVFTGPGTWFSLAVVVWSYAGQTIGELRWKPDLTLRETGEARANLFIHRTLVMGLLVFWGKWGQPPRWALAAYVLFVACLFTYTQLNPERYLRLIGFKSKRRSGKGAAIDKASRPNQTKGSGGSRPT
jgi:hypothetical protein